jgi:hypothetical protein
MNSLLKRGNIISSKNNSLVLKFNISLTLKREITEFVVEFTKISGYKNNSRIGRLKHGGYYMYHWFDILKL